jgi:flagellar motility protein MotE (MotC chaperone)
MAKKPERRQKLKVFRTPIGFHDAYVAAPSRKAALEAWGADSNIFAQGIAEEVTDPKLMEEPLARPGKVIRRARGSADDHFAELERSAPKRKKAAHGDEDGEGAVAPKRRSTPGPKPSREELDAADEALEKAEKKQRRKLGEIDEKMRELERRRRQLQRKHEEERDVLARRRDEARSGYDRALREWNRGR